MTHAQRKHLQNRLDGTIRVLRERIPRSYDLPMPPAIRRAKLIVDRWRKKVEQDAARARAVVEDGARDAREAILFGDGKAALAAVQAYERNARRRFRARKAKD
jgi:hypothetical protein